MIDKGKFDQAVKLLVDSGATTIVLLAHDGKCQSVHVDGLGIDIYKCLYACMKRDDHFAILVETASSIYHEEKEIERNNKNNE